MTSWLSFLRALLLDPMDRDQVGVWVRALTVGIMLHIAWACSWLPGVQGFAQASDLAPLISDVHRIQLANIRRSIADTQKELCLLGANADIPAAIKRELREDFESLLAVDLIEFELVAGFPYRSRLECAYATPQPSQQGNHLSRSIN